MKQDLIFDVEMHRGVDRQWYWAKGSLSLPQK